MADRGRVLEILLGLKDRKLRSDLRKTKREMVSFGRETSRKLRSSFKDAFSTVAGVGSVAGVAAVGKNVLDVDRKLTRLGIQAGKSKTEMLAFHGELRDMSDETGLSTENLADAAAKFVSLTGNYDQAKRGALVFAKASQASGASIEDVAAAAASLSNNLGISDIEGFEKGLSMLLDQGKAGAVELRELAGLLPSIAPSFTQFGKSGTEGLAELGAGLQVIRQGFGSGSEAATGLNALMTALARNAGKLEKAGVQVYEPPDENGVRRLRQFSAIVDSIGRSDLMKSDTKLIDALGSSEAKRALMELSKPTGWKSFNTLWQESQGSNAVNDDFAVYMESNAGRIDKAWQRLQNTLARQLTPERVEDLVAAFEALGRGAAWVVRNIKGVLLAFGALKLAQWGMRLYSFAGALGSAGGQAQKLADASTGLGTRGLSGVSKFSRALGALGAIPGVFALGYQLGGLISKALGLSDALEDMHDVTPTESLGEFDPDKKAALLMNTVQSRRRRASQLSSEIQEYEGRAGGWSDKGLSTEIEEKKQQLKAVEYFIERDTRRAHAVQAVERVNRAGTVNLEEAVPAVGPVKPEAMQAIATAVLAQTGKKGDDPELRAIMREVLDEIRRGNADKSNRDVDTAFLLAAWDNNVGRGPAP